MYKSEHLPTLIWLMIPVSTNLEMAIWTEIRVLWSRVNGRFQKIYVSLEMSGLRWKICWMLLTLNILGGKLCDENTKKFMPKSSHCHGLLEGWATDQDDRIIPSCSLLPSAVVVLEWGDWGADQTPFLQGIWSTRDLHSAF